MSLSRRVSLNAAGQIAGRLYTSVLSFVITAVLLSRLLSAVDFGIFSFYLSLYQLLTNVIDFGAGTIVVRDASRDRERAGELIGLLVLIKLAMAALGVVLLWGVAFAFEGLGARFGWLALATTHLLFHAPGGAAAIFHVDMVFKWAVAANVLGQSAWLLATVALLLLGVTEPAPYLLAFGVGPMVTGVLGYLLARRRVVIRLQSSRAALAGLWREAWPAGVSMALASVYFYLDAAMLRPMSGEVAVGHYRAAYSIMTFALMVPVLFSQVVFPVYARLWGRRAPGLAAFHQRTLRLLFTLGLLVSVTVPQLRAEIMTVVYEPPFAVAAPCLGVLFMAVVLVFCAYPHVMLLLASGNQRTMMLVSGSAAAFNVLANLWAIPRFGIEGAAATTVATEGWVLVAAMIAVRRHIGIGPALAGLARPALAALFAGLALALLLSATPGLGPGLRILLGVAVAAAGAWAGGVLPVDLGGDEGAPEPEPSR